MSIFIPSLREYAPFYIQRATDAAAIDIQSAYGVTIQVHEYPSKLKVKQPYKNDWKDRHGDEEYTGHLYYEAFTLNLKCVILTNEADASTSRAELRSQVRAFQAAIGQGEFSIYDDWTKYGFRHVRLDEFPQISEGDFDNFNGHCRLIFSVILKVNDPATGMQLSSGSIVEE